MKKKKLVVARSTKSFLLKLILIKTLTKKAKNRSRTLMALKAVLSEKLLTNSSVNAFEKTANVKITIENLFRKICAELTFRQTLF